MPILLTGWNPFYEGWLAGAFGLPCEAVGETECDRDGWREGWQMARETGLEGVRLALTLELESGDHVKAEVVR